MSLLGADIGTSGLKAVVIEAESGDVLASAGIEYPNTFPAPGRSELDPEVVWTAFRDVVRTVAADERVAHDPIAAMSFSTSGDEIVLLDRRRRPLDRVVLSADQRGAELLDRVRRHIDELDLFSLTGIPLYPAFPLVRLLWYRDRHPDLFEEIHRVVGWGEFLMTRLGLPPIVDYTSAARWMLFDIRRRRWAEALLELVNQPVIALPEPAPSGTPVGRLAADVALDLGLRGRPLVVAGGYDQVCAAVGGGVSRPGDAAVGTGTWEVLSTLVREPVADRAAFGRGYAFGNFVTPDVFVGAAMNAGGGSVLRWFRDQFGEPDRRRAVEEGSDVFEYLLRSMPDGPSGLLFLPHLHGSNNPWKDPLARGAVVGLSAATTRGEFILGLLEGITFELRLNLEGLRATGCSFSVLRNTGGGARSRRWPQLKADITGLPVETVTVREAGCLAAAMLAGVGSDTYGSIEEPQQRFVRPERRYEPDPGRRAQYDALFAVYAELYPALAAINRRLPDG